VLVSADLGQVGRWMSREGLVAAELGEDAMLAPPRSALPERVPYDLERAL